MLTLITGTPGAGKSLYAVSELAVKVPGSTVEDGQTAVPRKLYSNIKDLLVEHTHITAENLNNWHEWAKPGDVILFDEVQEVWRPRGINNKVPECIAKLETHRHMGVDLILVTQHPMLLDQNIRRLVNQHLHLRRIAGGISMVYEWDHCSDTKTTKMCIDSRFWWYPKKAFKLYKSAQLHTKTKARIPKIAYVGVAAIAALVYMVPMTMGRLNGVFHRGEAVAATPGVSTTTTTTTTHENPQPIPAIAEPGESIPSSPVPAEPKPVLAGCVWTPKRCACVDTQGHRMEPDEDSCKSLGVGPVLTLASLPEPRRPPNPSDVEVYSFLRKTRGSPLRTE